MRIPGSSADRDPRRLPAADLRLRSAPPAELRPLHQRSRARYPADRRAPGTFCWSKPRSRATSSWPTSRSRAASLELSARLLGRTPSLMRREDAHSASSVRCCVSGHTITNTRWLTVPPASHRNVVHPKRQHTYLSYVLVPILPMFDADSDVPSCAPGCGSGRASLLPRSRG